MSDCEGKFNKTNEADGVTTYFVSISGILRICAAELDRERANTPCFVDLR